MAVSVSHNTAADRNTFTEEVMLMKTGAPWLSRIKEEFYPLRPVYCGGESSFYDRPIVKTHGISDTTEIVNPHATMTHVPYIEPEVEPEEEEVGSGLHAAPITLSALYKFGQITNEMIHTGGGVVPQGKIAQGNVPPNTANIGPTLGMEPFLVFNAGNVSNPAVNTSQPIEKIAEPSLSVELLDFNIEGHNGTTGDKTKAIAVIPKEELQTGETSGVLHYNSAFPIPIELNLNHAQTFYSLTAVLRLRDGRLPTDLLNPTEMTLLLGETDESKQQRVMNQAIENLAALTANRQELKIATIGQNNPVL